MWPIAVDYAVYLYNHMTNEKGIAPADLFIGVNSRRHKLWDFHMWGDPVYVLDSTLESGKKLPRWHPRSFKGMFAGLSSVHSSDVPLILNLRKGNISPQYHVVFDDDFSTISSQSESLEPLSWWNTVDLEECNLRIPLDNESTIQLAKDWIYPEELEERYRTYIR